MAAMSRHLAVIAGVVLLGMSITVTPTNAQFMQLFGFPSAEPPPPLPPEAIAARLARFNYKLTKLRRGPQGYIVDAIDPSGRPVRLVMDPIDGALLQRTYLSPPPEASPGAGGAPPSQERSRTAPSTRQGQSAQSRDANQKPGAEPAQATPAPAAPPPAKAPEPFVPKTGPGYSHGVPINPLD